MKRNVNPQVIASLSRWLDYVFGPDWTDVKGIGGRYVTHEQLMAATKEWDRLKKKEAKQ